MAGDKDRTGVAYSNGFLKLVLKYLPFVGHLKMLTIQKVRISALYMSTRMRKGILGSIYQ